MGCSQAKSTASSPKDDEVAAEAKIPAEDKTLLPATSSGTSEQKDNSGPVSQFCFMKIAIKSGAVDSIVTILNSAPIQKTLTEVQGLKEMVVTRADNQDPTTNEEAIFINSKYDSQAAWQASDAKFADVLKSMEQHFRAAPERFYAKGGSVVLKGETLWTFNVALASSTGTGPAQSIFHGMMRIAIKPGAIESLILLLKSPAVQKALSEVDGLKDFLVKQVPDTDAIYIHSQYESDMALQAALLKVGDVLKKMEEHFGGAPEHFRATGGLVQLSGETLWTFGKTRETFGDTVESRPVQSGTVEEVAATSPCKCSLFC